RIAAASAPEMPKLTESIDLVRTQDRRLTIVEGAVLRAGGFRGIYSGHSSSLSLWRRLPSGAPSSPPFQVKLPELPPDLVRRRASAAGAVHGRGVCAR